MIITFDFDGTLENEFDDSLNPQKEEIQSIAKRLISEGHDVRILTRRYDKNNKHLGKLNEHIEVFETANKLGIQKVHFTNRDSKYIHILNEKIDIHFENCINEVDLSRKACMAANHYCQLIHVESPNWQNSLKV